jgi:hypothetical protein
VRTAYGKIDTLWGIHQLKCPMNGANKKVYEFLNMLLAYAQKEFFAGKYDISER